MKNTLNHYIRNFQDKHKSIRLYLAVFLVLAAGIFLVVSWKLHHTGISMTADYQCGYTAEHEIDSADPKLTSLSGGDVFKGNVTTGAVSANIVNKSGSTLPETGGIGTTVFYVIGGMLMAAAAVLLITKKRMNNK